jgi:N12 class adenine-specific DNA methylase
MGQSEYETWYEDNMGEKDNIPYSERMSQWKKQGKLSLILGKPILDKSPNNDIMTSSEGRENDNRNEVRGLATGTEGTGLHGREQAESMEGHESERTKEIRTGQSESREGIRSESNDSRDTGLQGVESSNPSGDSGERKRLEPKDIELTEHSDIGFSSGAASRFDANVTAIKTLKTIEDEHREATPDEQKILSKYSGFGDSSMGEAFPRYEGGGYSNTPWGRRRAELKAITTDDEFKAIEHSRLNAFYTTPEVIGSMWKSLEKMGVDKLSNPRVLEPSAGSGRFLGYEPKALADKSQRVAVELDPLTGRMLKQMYPKTETYVMGFEKAPIPKDSIDIAISNVPFGNYPIFDPTFKKDRKKLTGSIHNYFFAKSLEELRAGGVLAFITSHQTMDAPTAKPIRQALAKDADLIAAYRLPNNAFPDTQVVTDVIFMRKRMEGEKPGDDSWVDTEKHEYKMKSNYSDSEQDVELSVNKYFLDHPEMVLGKPSANGSMNPHGYNEGEYTVEPGPTPLPQLLNKAIEHIPKDIITNAPRRDLKRRVYDKATADIYENSRVIGEDNKVYVKKNGALETANLTATEEAKVKSILKIRNDAKKVIDIQVKNGSDEDLQTAQSKLRSDYKEYVTAHGPLTAPANADLIEGDPDAPFLRALENVGDILRKKDNLTPEEEHMVKVLKGKLPAKETDIEKLQMPIFTKRIIHGLGEKPVNSYADAESVVKNEVGHLDFAIMAEKLGKTENEVIKGLADQKLIYHNPMSGEWEPADKYLTGDVRLKLKQAEAAATARPKEFNVNVEDLKIVQPEDIPAGQIAVRMGAPWIPSSDINDFTVDILNASRYRRGRFSYRQSEEVNQYVHYNPTTGEWSVEGKGGFGDYTALNETYGTSRMPANKILEHILNGQLIEVKDKVTENGTEKSVRNPQETIAAQEKAKLLQSKFQEWIWSNPERTERLTASYNEKFNSYRPRTFDGKHLELPGITDKWHKQMLSHQKDAVWRVIQDRTALLAHEVGFGKTAVMAVSGMELRRMGLSRKNLYVTPKATSNQFKNDFQDIYPYAKILYPGKDDFTPEKRAEFMSRAVTGDWDAIIVADSQFAKIPVKPETEARFLNEEMDTIRDALTDAQQKNDKRSQKDLEKSLERAKVRMETLQDKIKDRSDKTVYFEDMGVDQMYVDEADMYKNLKFTTRMGRVKGLPNSESQRAWDMYTKTRSLQEDKHNGVVFASGTPIANTIAEMYTMMRYLQEPTLEEKGLKHFDAWAKTFGETTESLEQTPTGAYKMTQRFSKFQNAPELSNMWQGVADIRVADEVPEMVAARPRIVDKEGKPRRIVVATPGDKALADYMLELAERADQLKGMPEKGGDNMLKISGDARKASLDMRLVKADAPVNPKGKIATACQQITDIYKETTPDKGTQLVFLDLGTPKAKEKEPEYDKDGNVINEESDETADEAKLLTDVYRNVKSQLIADGVDAKDIAFAHDAKTDPQKQELYRKVNSGEIRVLIGSTGKMGAGVNVQRRAAALHHLDAPWRPRDIEQREGRVIRQGNIVYGPIKEENGKVINPGKGVRIYTYVTEKSFDAFMWQAIEAKSKAIKSIMRRSVPPRSIEDVDSFTMSASEAKAIASGNPDVFKQVALKNAVARFAMLKASHTDQIVRARSQVKLLPKQIEALNNDIGKMEKDAKLVKESPKFAMKVQGDDFEERSEAGPALLRAIQHAKDNEKLAEYQGFDVKVLDHGPQAGYELLVENPATGQRYSNGTNIMYADITAPGAVVRLDNTIKKIPQRLEDSRQQLKEAEKSLSTYKELENKPFDYEKQLDSAEKELSKVSLRLQGEKVEENESDNYVPPEDPGEVEPTYHYSARGEDIKAEDEVAAVKAEVGNVEKETEIKAAPAIQEVAAVNKIEELAHVSEPEQPMFRENGAKTKAEQEKQASTIEKEAVVNEKRRVETPIVEPEKPKLMPFPGNDPQKTSGSFNVYNTNAYISDKHLTTPAEKITIPGFEEYNFFIARPTTTGGKFSNKDWDIYETTTGMSIGALRKTKAEAIENATLKITNYIGKEKLTKAIADGLEKQGRDRSLAPQPKATDIAAVATEPKAETKVVTEPVESSLIQAVRTENHKEEDRLAKQGGTGKMVLMTKELAKQFPRIYSGEKVPEGDRVVIAKFFHPMSHQTWYATEYDPEEQIFYGYIDTGDHDSEWGNFSLDEMQDLKVKGLGMERDIHFTPQKIENVSGLHDRFKTSPESEVKNTYKEQAKKNADGDARALAERKKWFAPMKETEKAAETVTEPKAPAPKEETPANPKLDDEFYANISDGRGFKPVKAKKVVIPGYEKSELYLHHPVSVDDKGNLVEDKNQWGISEGRSGLYLGDDITSPQADWAVDRLKSKLARKMTPDKLEQSVENAIKKSGESPKYETETPIAKMQRQVHEIYNMPKSETPAVPKVEEPTHPFIGLYKGKQYESHAVSLYAAQQEIAKRVGARHDYDVSVYAATETEPLAAAIEHEKELPEETPYIEEGGKATRKSKPSIETHAVAHVQQQPFEEAPIVEGEVKRNSKPSIDNAFGKPVREPSEKPVVLTPAEVKAIAAGSADILKEQNEKPVILTKEEVKAIAAPSPEI